MTREKIEREAEAFLRAHRAGPRTIESLSLDLADLIERMIEDSKGPCKHEQEALDRARDDSGYF